MTAATDWYSDTENVLDVLRGERAERRTLPTIPGYEQIEEISRGGQGVVYSALQRSTHQRVAIKVLLDGAYATAASLRRFEREIELVAALRHPNIVRVYDSGVSTEGRPYCVMEYIDGAPLDHFLRAPSRGRTDKARDHHAEFQNDGFQNAEFQSRDRKGAVSRDSESPPPHVRSSKQHARTPSEVLTLFLDICDAVHHAHQHGVMHRDLKPSNIRVDADGRPHILDFGLAKAAGDDAARGIAARTLTHSGHFFGSLPWASPEQVRGDPRAMDLRADVYALGVVLYQSLSGRFPYDVSGPMHEVSQRILNAEPTRPGLPDRPLHDDLCIIILKCLAKDAARRYQSAGDLAADLRRFLKGEPIAARADSTWYVVRKTLRRHRYAAASATMLIVLLAGFAATMSVMYRQTVLARDRAQAEADKAAAVNAFMREMLMSVEPGRNGYRATVVEVLDQAARDAPARFANQPEIEAALEHTMGEAYTNLGRYADGRRHLERALALRRRVLGEDHPDTLETMEQISWGSNDTTPSGLAANRDRMLHVFESRSRALGADHPKTISAELLLRLLQARGDLARNEAALRSAIDHAARILGHEDAVTIQGLLSLSATLNAASRPAEAEPIARRALAVTEKRADPEHRDKLASMMELGDSLIQQKRYAEALPLVTFPYEVKVRVLGARHPATITSARQLMRVYQGLDKPDEARTLAQASGESVDVAP